MTPDVTILIEDPLWRKVPAARADLKRAALAALARAGDDCGTLTILLANNKKLHALNTSFRGQDKPTNVLSFPSAEMDYLGDIAIAYGVTATEAEAQGKPFAHHATHLVVHGVLHLLGFDHETDVDAQAMEPLEIEILKGLGIPDPYLLKAS